MMPAIRRDNDRLSSTALSLRGQRSQVLQLVANLDAAVSPALRGDVPESGEISSLYQTLRGRTTITADGLLTYSNHLLTYIGNGTEMERLNSLLILKASAGTIFAAWLQRSGVDAVTSLAAKTALKALDAGGPAGGQAYTSGATKHLLGEMDAHPENYRLGLPLGLAMTLNKMLVGYQVFQNVKTWAGIGQLHGYERHVTTVSTAAGSASLLGTLASTVAKEGAAKTFFKRFAGPVGTLATGWEVGKAIGDGERQHFDDIEARGGNVVATAQREALLGGPVTVLDQTHVGLAVLHQASGWLGKKVYGVTEDEPDVLLPSHTSAVLYAGIREKFPTAQIVQEDGRYSVIIPGDLPQRFTFDTLTGKRIR